MSDNRTEQQFLAEYDISRYDRPSVTADIALFTLRMEAEDSYRREPRSNLSLLLIQRGGHPFKGCWALPGGFVHSDETIEACAIREITEEAGITPAALMPCEVFSAPERDPRGRIISHSFVSVAVNGTEHIHGGDDAVDARWFDISLDKIEGICTLRLRNDDTELCAKLASHSARFGRTDFEIIDSGGLAFDHAKIIAAALKRLQSCAEDFELIFDFLPDKFTLSELQRVQETITGKPVVAANFRRKISGYVTETDESTSGAGHRPAKLFTKYIQEDLT